VGAELAGRITREIGGTPAYVHLDLDALDPSAGHANGYAAPDGVSATSLASFCAALAERVPRAAITPSRTIPLWMRMAPWRSGWWTRCSAQPVRRPPEVECARVSVSRRCPARLSAPGDERCGSCSARGCA
jgi:hypothetical protein